MDKHARTRTACTRLRKGMRVETHLGTFAVEWIKPGADYAYAVGFAPGGGPPVDGIRIFRFADVLRVYC